MQFTVDKDVVIRKWPRMEEYQNSTLRYTPPKNFPAYWAGINGRPKIMRCWITLDEVWDYRTDEYNWNYQIGVNKYENDPKHYIYDWDRTVPSDTLFEDYLTSFCAIADDVMLNIRRYERETADGIVSYEKYEEVVEKVIAHCKALCPNIKYIEVCNESEAKVFGGITVPQYMKLYDCVCRAVNRLNKNYKEPLLVGGSAITGHWYFSMWREILEAFAADKTPELRIDFYSMHDYDPDTSRLQSMYNLHKSAVAELGLPDGPMYYNEYGTRRATGILEDSLGNASETLTGMMRASDMQGMYVFPWCTFHNPKLQMSYSQYLRQPDDSYVPTPNGQAMTMLHNMLRDELLVTGDTNYRVRATSGATNGATCEGDSIAIIITNPCAVSLEIWGIVKGLAPGKVKVIAFQVDAKQNNCVTGPVCDRLNVTSERIVDVTENGMELPWALPPFGFVFLKLIRAGT